MAIAVLFVVRTVNQTNFWSKVCHAEHKDHSTSKGRVIFGVFLAHLLLKGKYILSGAPTLGWSLPSHSTGAVRQPKHKNLVEGGWRGGFVRRWFNFSHNLPCPRRTCCPSSSLLRPNPFSILTLSYALLSLRGAYPLPSGFLLPYM